MILGVAILNLEKSILEQISDIFLKTLRINSKGNEKKFEIPIENKDIIIVIYPQRSIKPSIGAIKILVIKKLKEIIL